MSVRIQGEPAFALHSRPYRETSTITELLTLNHGRIAVVARGVRGPRRRGRGTALSVQPFSRLVISCTGRGQLQTLTAAEPVGHRWLTASALYAGLYLNELLLRLLKHQDPHPELFAGYDTALGGLDAPGRDVEPVLRRFEKLLLRECGYELVFDYDAHSGEPVAADDRYHFVSEHGFVLVGAAVREATPTYATGDAEALTVPGHVLLAISADDYGDAHVRRFAKRIMRRALAPHLGGRGLNSRSLFREQDAS
jgi:DNA repair protein RecO (recombination protein O)